MLISIHTPLAGSDSPSNAVRSASSDFNPHSPCGERRTRVRKTGSARHFNPHSPCGERRYDTDITCNGSYFNPHSPCGERRAPLTIRSKTIYFNPHSPCGERLKSGIGHDGSFHNFNPHSPCGERPPFSTICATESVFQSTLPLRGATIHDNTSGFSARISIHTPLAGSDALQRCFPYRPAYFNPHSPCGERHGVAGTDHDATHFNPHSPCGERLDPHEDAYDHTDFNPHSPCGERLPYGTLRRILELFQSTLPLRGATSASCSVSIPPKFQSTLPLRGATAEMRHF